MLLEERPRKATQRPPIRNVAKLVHDALMADEWPSQAGIIDYGLASQEHYAALQYAVRHGRVTLRQLDDALGNGPAITRLINIDNPHLGVLFSTAWDRVLVSLQHLMGPDTAFPLGRLFATGRVLQRIASQEIIRAVHLHRRRLWRAKEITPDDLCQAVTSERGVGFWVTTEPDHSTTLVSLNGGDPEPEATEASD